MQLAPSHTVFPTRKQRVQSGKVSMIYTPNRVKKHSTVYTKMFTPFWVHLCPTIAIRLASASFLENTALTTFLRRILSHVDNAHAVHGLEAQGTRGGFWEANAG